MELLAKKFSQSWRNDCNPQRGFIDPFAFPGSGVLNLEHQAVVYQAVFESFWKPRCLWFGGISLWDIAVDPSKTGAKDNEFSPLGKEQTEEVVKDYYLKNN